MRWTADGLWYVCGMAVQGVAAGGHLQVATD